MWQGFNPNELKLVMMFGLSLLSNLKTTIFPLGLFFVPFVSTVDKPNYCYHNTNMSCNLMQYYFYH